jgi:hypothetical protein
MTVNREFLSISLFPLCGLMNVVAVCRDVNGGQMLRLKDARSRPQRVSLAGTNDLVANRLILYQDQYEHQDAD